jgi:hypothetical protein
LIRGLTMPQSLTDNVRCDDYVKANVLMT